MVIGGKSQTPLVSVIMPTYNQADYIGAAIESVLGQTYSNFELIIVNNHSSDHTEKVIAAYPDSRIQYFKFSNKGIIAASRNFGIKKSQGKYIAFLDSDDLWMEQKLAKQVSLMEKQADISLSYVLFGHLYKSGKIKGSFPYPSNRKRGHIFRDLYLFNSIANSSAMVRAHIFEELGFLDKDPHLVGVEDADMWLRIAKRDPVGFVDREILMLYRVGGNNILYRKVLEKAQRRFYLAKKYFPDVGFRWYLYKIAFYPFYCIFRRLFTDHLVKTYGIGRIEG